ncbi:imidazole glycerol phosphate synthase, glutamine amidotransferase subunit [Candidatus Collierbacteria bacterium RIFCSPHIGHO2_02_FULL_49_10]|uniref:Imidazole glycerol phosphate synthase subunit HisH n=1 Tax=Candidatus Collierbacteria bacterium RIFCSPHIGHO2_02_FULL_49_10 TaxID=1817723 RepID=A0A1F5EWU6_9BACT|nr:MAG: imidazole glycerol phosphate synthase, glutamine amidotransferase subunit [Candidatus Collierbacteria bacterium RIFCSPHIGHO2_02_FULL_49_10]
MIVVIDYGMGNLHSIAKALEYVGAEVLISSKIPDVKRADKLVLPGIGAFGDGIANLRELGLLDVLREEIVAKAKPFLGICLGMQLLADRSFEFGEHEGLGLVRGDVVKFEFGDEKLRVPHVGWNDVDFRRFSPLFAGIKNHTDFYFVHSYHFVPSGLAAALCDYGGPFAAALQQGNIFATQFHPEKSQKAGLKLLQNFLEWNPSHA